MLSSLRRHLFTETSLNWIFSFDKLNIHSNLKLFTKQFQLLIPSFQHSFKSMAIRNGHQIYLIRSILDKQCWLFSTASCTGTHAARPTCKWSENGNKQWNKNLLMILANWEEQREGQTDRNYGSFYETNCLNSKTEDENLQTVLHTRGKNKSWFSI